MINFAQTGVLLNRVREYTDDYQAILDRGTALGYTLPGTTKQIQENAFMVALKAVFGVNSITDAPILQALMFKTDGDSDYATLNWVDPTIRQATKVNSPTFTSDTGFNSNGTTSYLQGGITSLTLDQQDFSIAIRGYTNSGINGELITGVGDLTSADAECMFINPRNAAGDFRYRAFGDSATFGPAIANSTSRIIISRGNGTTVERSFNGAAQTSSANGANAMESDRDIPILAYNGSAGITGFHTRGVSYRLIFSRKLTNTEVANLDDALVDYLA